MRHLKMEIFLLTVILTLLSIVVHQGRQRREPEKRFDELKIVCQKINVRKEGK